MTSVSSPSSPPRNLLLATDLSCACDRALDRAVQLAGQWGATLHVVHALRPEIRSGAWWAADGGDRPTEQARAAQVRRQIAQDLDGIPDNVRVHVQEGPPVDVITAVALAESCPLIVLGTSGSGFADLIVSSTTERLLRRLPCSVLVVKARPFRSYRRVLVGTDFTVESRVGLETAAAWFGDAHFIVTHAVDVPYRSIIGETEWVRVAYRPGQEAMQDFLDSTSLDAVRREAMATLVDSGAPENILADQVEAVGADLVVVGALLRGLAFHLVVGGNAWRIVQAVSSDVLVVHGVVGEPY